MPNKDIQPKYYDDAKFVCSSCGNEFTCGTTKGEEVRVDICYNCHPFYTGNQKFNQNQGRVEQFNAKFERQKEVAAKAAADSKAQLAENEKNADKKDDKKSK